MAGTIQIRGRSFTGCPDRPGSLHPRDLGFTRKRMVQWFGPRELAATASRLVLSSVLGAYLDKRELQAALKAPQVHDQSSKREVWIDYVSDLGDGFDPTYAVASVLSRERLSLEKDGDVFHTHRGDLLVMGGDEIYPYPTSADYEDRVIGPYRAALPCTPDGHHPALFAVPGNHDWYDGLTAFIRAFCQENWVGGWRTAQNRSYFAVKLPHRWWLWGIDIQFDSYIDEPQLDFFTEIAGEARGDRIILCTAKPAWVHSELKGDRRYKAELKGSNNLEYFERKVIRKYGLRLAVTLTGDLHHYSRYGSDRGAQKIIAGGGGAYLYPTHHLPPKLCWRLEEDEDHLAVEETYTRRCIYPEASESRRRIPGALLLPFKNPGFWVLTAALQVLFALLLRLSLRRPGSFAAPLVEASLADLVQAAIRNPATIVLAGVVIRALVGLADAQHRPTRWALGGTHGLAQVGLSITAVWLCAEASSALGLAGASYASVFIGLLAVAGGFAAALLMGLYLLLSHLLFGCHGNEVFASQHITLFKNFLRIHLNQRGDLVIYAVGLDEVPTKWRATEHGAQDDSWLEPEAGQVTPRLIEPPVPVSGSAD